MSGCVWINEVLLYLQINISTYMVIDRVKCAYTSCSKKQIAISREFNNKNTNNTDIK